MTNPDKPTISQDIRIRHSLDIDEIQRRALSFESHLLAKVEAARRNLIICNSLRLQSLEYAAQTLVLDPESPQVWRWLRVGSQAAEAIFAGAMATGDHIEVRIGEGSPTRVPSAVTPDLHDVGNWTDGFLMATICREKEVVDSLCRVPIELLRRSTTRGLEHTYLFVQALQSYCRRGQDSAEWAQAALRATEDRSIPSPTLNTTRELSRPAIEVLLRLIGGRGELLNESLTRALELHREFWGRSEDKARDPSGYFSLRLTGLAALAHDAGIPITVESDYLPMALVRGNRRPSD
jgi:hypothetical protein